MDDEDKKKTKTAIKNPQLPDDLVFELCSRLPFKKLFQFRCISKSWHSILRHPSLADAYRRHNPYALVISVLGKAGQDVSSGQQRFYYSSLGEASAATETEEFVNPFDVSLSEYPGVTQVVNGLVCFYSQDCLFLVNVCTGEIMRLPCAPGLEGLRLRGSLKEKTRYFLGFDSINRVYKLLNIMDTGHRYNWEILTLGGGGGGSSDSSSLWRKLDGVPQILPAGSFVADKMLFWVRTEPRIGYANGFRGLCLELFSRFLIAFDLAEEKFHYIRPPRHLWTYHIHAPWLAKFRGGLCLCHLGSKEKLILHVLEDDEGHDWAKIEILLPEELDYNAIPVGCLPTGEVLLANSRSQGEQTPVYCYDDERNRFRRRFVVGKLPQSEDLRNRKYAFGIFCVEPKLDTLEALVRGKTDSTLDSELSRRECSIY